MMANLQLVLRLRLPAKNKDLERPFILAILYLAVSLSRPMRCCKSRRGEVGTKLQACCLQVFFK